MHRRLRSSVLAFALILALVPRLGAQSQATTGVIEGLVLDPEGAIRPGASVAVRNTATNFEQTHVTDATAGSGHCCFPSALTGSPSLSRASRRSSGKASTSRSAQTINLPLRLELSTVTQEVKVSAQAPVVETSEDGVDRSASMKRPSQKLPNQRAQLPRLHEAHARRQHRPGARTATSSRSTGRREFRTTSPSTAPTSTTRSSASSAAGSVRRSPSTSTRSRKSSSWRRARTPSSGAPPAGFVNVVTKSGTNDIHASGALLLQEPGLLRERPRRAAAPRPEVPTSIATRRAPRSAGRSCRTTSSTSSPPTTRTGAPTKQTDPNRIEQRRRGRFASLGYPDENLPIERTDDARRVPRKIGLADASDSTFSPCGYAYTWADQHNGTFDVDSWGRSANADEKDLSKAVTGSAFFDASRQPRQRVPLPVRPRGPAAPIQRARRHRAQAGRCPTRRSIS